MIGMNRPKVESRPYEFLLQDLPGSGIETVSLVLEGRFFTTDPRGKLRIFTF